MPLTAESILILSGALELPMLHMKQGTANILCTRQLKVFAFLNNKSKVQESTATESSVRNWAYRRNSHYNNTYVALGGDRLWSDVDYSSFSVTFNYIPQRSEAYGEDLRNLR